MAGEMLLINPRRRTARRAANPKRRRVGVRRRRNPVPVGLARYQAARRRRRNPVAAVGARRRRRNPVALSRARRVGARRRRNPLSMGGMGFYTNLLKDAAIGGAGSVAMDFLMEQLNPMLPASLQPTAGTVSANDAVKALITAFLGKLLSSETKGLSVTAARGSLTVQAAALIGTMIPVGSGAVGYYSPARIIQGTNRVGPIRKGVNAYITPGKTPLLNGMQAYTQPGRSPLLSGRTVQQREGVSTYY